MNKELLLSHSAKIVEDLCKIFPDPRKKRGIRFPYKFIMHLIVLAIIFGCRHVDAIDDFIHSKTALLHIKKFFRKVRIPCIGCLRYMMLKLDADNLMKKINEVLIFLENNSTPKTTTDELNGHAIAIDGKTLRGAHAYGDRPPATLNAVYHDTGITIAQVQMEVSKTNEIIDAQKFLQNSDLKGSIITLDAIHTQTKTAQLISDKQAFYVFTVKDNQSNLKEMIEDESLNASSPKYEEPADKAHGRIEQRRIWTKPAPDYISELFPDSKQIFVIEREIFHISKNNTTNDFCYGITNLTETNANAENILKLNRGHWAIENKLHHCLDVSMGEDACKCRTGQLPFVLSVFRKLALNIFRYCGVTNIAKTMRQLAYS